MTVSSGNRGSAGALERPMLSLATHVALTACAAFAASIPRPTVFLSGSPILTEAFREIFQPNPCNEGILFPTGQTNLPLSMKSGQEINLVWIDPVLETQNTFLTLARDYPIVQFLLLQPGWLGRALLPEWKNPAGRSRSYQANFPRITRFSIGGLSSLGWGLLAGRMLAWDRPDLADACNARMRRDFYPTARHTSLAYLSILRAVLAPSPAEGRPA